MFHRPLKLIVCSLVAVAAPMFATGLVGMSASSMDHSQDARMQDVRTVPEQSNVRRDVNRVDNPIVPQPQADQHYQRPVIRNNVESVDKSNRMQIQDNDEDDSEDNDLALFFESDNNGSTNVVVPVPIPSERRSDDRFREVDDSNAVITPQPVDRRVNEPGVIIDDEEDQVVVPQPRESERVRVRQNDSGDVRIQPVPPLPRVRIEGNLAMASDDARMAPESGDHVVPQPMPGKVEKDKVVPPEHKSTVSPQPVDEDEVKDGSIAEVTSVDTSTTNTGSSSIVKPTTNKPVTPLVVPAPSVSSDVPVANPTIAPSERDAAKVKVDVPPETDVPQPNVDHAVTPPTTSVSTDTTKSMSTEKVKAVSSDAVTPAPTTTVPAGTSTSVENVDMKVSGNDQPYHNAQKGYTIVFPSNWEVKEGFMGLDVFGLSALKNSEDKFRENVNVVTEDLRTPLTLDEYYDLGVKNLSMLLTDFKEIDTGRVDVNGVPARWIVYDHRMGEVRARVLQVIMVKGDRAYIITATATPEEFDSYRGSFDTIVKSFKFGA